MTTTYRARTHASPAAPHGRHVQWQTHISTVPEEGLCH